MSNRKDADSAAGRAEERDLLVEEIFRDPELQVRRGLSRATVRHYADLMRQGTEFPPVEVARVEDGTLVLVDGWHRMAAKEELGRPRVTALVTPMPRLQAIWAAAQANVAHGLQLKKHEERNVFRAYVRSKQHRTKGGGFKSYRQIEKELGVGRAHTTIRNWMKQDFPSVAIAMRGRDDEERNEPTGEKPARPAWDYLWTLLQALEAAADRDYSPEERHEAIERLEGVAATIRSKGPTKKPLPPDF